MFRKQLIQYFATAIAITCLLCGQAFADSTYVKGHPEKYTVVKGDTLWDISERFLQSPWLWPEVWHANPQIANPHLIYPGDLIGFIYVDGKKRLTTLKAGPNNGVVKLSPKIRSTPISTAIPTIPLDAVIGFMTENRIVTVDELEAAPYILTGKDQRLVTAAGDSVFARGEAIPEDKLGVYRRNKQFVDPETNEFLGLEARSIATGQVTAVDGEVITLKILRSSEELRIGDHLLKTEDRVINSQFVPSKPESEVRGQMIAVEGGVGNIGQYDVVVINRGTREGLKEGNVLAVYKKSGIVRDPKTKEKIELPSERAGLMMIFRVFDKLSYGIILKATSALNVMDEVRNP